MKAKATSLADFEEIADSYAKENDSLRAEIDRLHSNIGDLRNKLLAADEQRDLLRSQLNEANVQLRYREEAASTETEIQPDTAAAEPPDAQPGIQDGETRFYKKKFSHQNRDEMIPVTDCGCNNWETAHAADKGVVPSAVES